MGDIEQDGPLHLVVGREHSDAAEPAGEVVEEAIEEPEELAGAEEEAGFDLGVDVGQPLVLGSESFDRETDLGYGNGPQES